MYSVRRGNLHIYRQFDIADAVDLDAAAKLVQRGETRRLDLRRVPKASVAIATPPLSFELGQQRLLVEGQDYAFDAHTRVFDFGVLSIVLRLDLAGSNLDTLAEKNAVLSSHPAVERLAKDLALQVSDDLRGAMLRPKFSGFYEDYTVVFVEQFAEKPTIAALRADPVLVRLLLAESAARSISQEASDDAMSTSFSYYADELAVIDYNSAFVYDPKGDYDIPDLIEFASAQLLEMRYYDHLLDRELGIMYGQVDRARRSLRTGANRALARRLMRVVMEVTELTEKIENSLKWVGDPYLARAYQAALGQFQLQRWQQQVQSKLNLMIKVVELLSDQLHSDRSLLLETLVVILILIEVVTPFLKL